jgi:DnaK suppressor protein
MTPGDYDPGERPQRVARAKNQEDYNMTPAEAERLANLLRKKQAELSRSLRNRDEIVIEKASDAIDEVQSMEERELAVRNLDRDSSALRQIHHALARIANGTYGVCLHCEENILPKRMAAVPWTAFCITCQEMIDHGEIDTDIESLAPAA